MGDRDEHMDMRCKVINAKEWDMWVEGLSTIDSLHMISR